MKKKRQNLEKLKIKEFSEYVGIPIELLRYYDNQDAFKPASRGDGEKNRYRYYTPFQITIAKMLLVLLGIGVSIKEIAFLRLNRTPKIILQLFTKQRNKIIERIRELQDSLSVIDEFIGLLNTAESADEEEIIAAEIPSRKILLGKTTDFTGEEGFIREFLNFCNDTHTPQLNTSFPIGGYWSDMDNFLDNSSRPERFFSLDSSGKTTVKGGLYLIGYTRGYYGETNDLPERMKIYAEENDYIFNGPVYNIYLIAEMSEPDPSKYLLQVSASVTKKRTPKRRELNEF